MAYRGSVPMMTKTLWPDQVNVPRRLPQALLLAILGIGFARWLRESSRRAAVFDATLQLRSAVASSGAAVVGELQRVEIRGPTATRSSWNNMGCAQSSL